MAESQNIVKGSLGDKESRLLRELEELKQAERVTELEREIAERKDKQRIKALKYDVKKRKRAEQVRKLERQVEEPQKRPRLNPESSCDVALIHDPNTQPSAKTDRSRDLVAVESTVRDDTPQAHCSQPTLPASISSETARNDSTAPDCPNEASTSMDAPHNSALAQVNNRPSSNDTVQQEPSTPIRIFAVSTNTRSPSISEAAAMQYYQELDEPADDSPELLFYDMNLEELYEFASPWEGNQEKNFGDLKMLSRLYYFIFTRTSAVDDIQKAIQRAEKALEATHTDNPNYAPCLRDMIVMLLKKHERTSSLEDLDQAILFAEVMVTVTPSLHPERPGRLRDLIKIKFKKAQQTGSTEDYNDAMVMDIEARCMVQGAGYDQASQYLNRFERTGDISDLNMAVARSEEAVAAIPHDYPDRAVTLSNLATSLSRRFERTGDISDLNIAIVRGEEVVAATPHDHLNRAAALNNLAASFSRRFERTGDISDLNIAVARSEEAVVATLYNHPNRAATLSNLAILLSRRFERSGDISDLNIAVVRSEEAVVATPHNHPDRAARLISLAVSLSRRFKWTSDISDLNIAIVRGKEAVAATPHNHPDRAGRLISLAVSLLRRFEQTGDISDLNIAIVRSEEAVAATPHNHPDRAGRLSSLAVCLSRRFERIGDISDLNIAIAKSKEAVVATPDNHPDRAARLINLATSLARRFKRTGDISDLNIGIAKGEEAVAATPHNHPNRAATLSNLAILLSRRFERSGDISDLNIAVVRSEEAVVATPHDHPDRAGTLNNLATSLWRRFERTGDVSDLNIAIARSEETVVATPHNHPDRASWLSNLATCFQARFERIGDLSDLNMAIARDKEAIVATPHDHPDRAGRLGNLAILLSRRFERSGDISDLNIAVVRGEEAVAAIPHDHPDRAGTLNNLATSLVRRFKGTGDISDLNIGIAKGEEAAAATPHDHPVRAATLSNLATSLFRRFERTGAQSDAKKAISLLVEVTELPNAEPHKRIKSASSAAKILAYNKKWAEASRITEIAVNLLPAVAPRQLKQQDQQYILGEFAGLAALAASTALEAGKEASQAVQLLELGRGVIAGLRFGTRSDLTKLKEQHPRIAEKFERLRDILDSPSPNMLDSITVGGTLSSTQGTNQRHNANLELDDIVRQIRCLPNFEHFLLPPQPDELKAAASQGPVVLINISEYRCDAFLIEKQAIRSIRLPALRQTDIKENVELMRSTRSAYKLSPDAKGQISCMLEWLWDVAVGPILDALGFRGAPSDGDWPRIWWIPTGPLSSLPLHAAGRHFPSSIETALDRVVSSYSPSIKALLYARQNSQKKNLSSTPHQALLVSMDTTSGHSDLRFAGEEVGRLASILSDPISKVTLERPAREAVLSALSKCTIFHFAGHGESHLSDPSRSSLLVSDWQENPLTVEHLMSLNLREKSPWLAYLSACSTSESNVDNLHDEAIHLVTACQLAGFQHVVGSLWEVSDRCSVDIAEEVYKTIVDGGTIDSEKIHLGVHKAARRLRDVTQEKGGERATGPSDSGGRDLSESGIRAARRVRPLGYEEGDTTERSDPLIWAAYIHAGP
ncbi:hypothetical protein ACMFMG_011101 [Clarireedia jacksonii]